MKNGELLEKVLDYLLKSDFVNGGVVKEVDLAKRFNVSSVPIREVLITLESKGFVERKQRKGTYLKPFSIKEMYDIYDLRSALEGLAAGLLSKNSDPGMIKALEKIAERYEGVEKPGELKILAQIDTEFHTFIVESCKNDALAGLVRDFHLITKSFKTFNGIDRIESRRENPYTHFKIIKAIEEKNAAKAERYARKHVEWVKDNTIKDLVIGEIKSG